MLDLSLEEIEQVVTPLGHKAFHARQVYSWLHKRCTFDPQLMTDVPVELRKQLSQRFDSSLLDLQETQHSADGSLKHIWLTPDGQPVESVFMPGFDYGTACCLSCQSGCPLGCLFCQTGYLGLRSQLSTSLILQQLYLAEQESGQAADRVVFMGMGEPLLNMAAVHRAVEALTSADGRAWSPRRITVSTVGLLRPLIKLAQSFPRVNLALSLHFTTTEMRALHMPKAERDPARLAEALYYYRLVNGGKVSIEYVLIAGLNDSDDDAWRLVRFARLADLPYDSLVKREAEASPRLPRLQSLPFHVNLIEYNPISAAPAYRPSTETRLNEFGRILGGAGVPVSVRHSRGADVAGACGMLGTGTNI